MSRLYACLVRALLRHRTITLEWFLALQSLTCGLWILSPHQSIRSDVILAVVPEWALGLVFAAHGLAATLVLVRGQFKQPRSQRNLDYCRRSALASAALWTILALGYALVPPVGSVAVPVLLGFVASALWVYLRLYLRYSEI